MRIIGGKYRGRRFTPPSNFKARPTTDFARESLFNILMGRYDFDGMHILDLFSGTGIIGLEFCSLGASKVTMVENNKKHFSFILKAIKILEAENTRAVCANVKSYIKNTSELFDIVFADPPYNILWLNTIPDLILGSGKLKNGGLFILEHSKQSNFNSHPLFFEHRSYGSVNFSFFTTS